MERERVLVEVEKLVTEEFRQKKKENRLSLAHDLTHVEGVANFASMAAKYLGQRRGVEDLEYLKWLAEIIGLLHDIKRDATEEVPHGLVGADYIRNNERIRALLLSEELNLVCRVIQYHEDSYEEISQRFEGLTLTRILGQAIVIGDKLAEASGPRVLERRSFFVGKERILSGDLKGKFKYPEESYLAVLGETIRRLYEINHAKNYSEEVRPFVDFLHPWQYEFYAGLLAKARMSEGEAGKYLKSRGFPKLDNALERIGERHLDGKFFKKKEFPQIAATIMNIAFADKKDLEESAYELVREYVLADSPDKAIAHLARKEYKYKYLEKWVNGIISYRNSTFVKEVEKKFNI